MARITAGRPAAGSAGDRGAISAPRGACLGHTCPQCGATFDTGETCEDRFYRGQALELADPAAYAVHQLSVPSYMLQHNAYSRDGWLLTRELLARFLAGLTPEAARQENREALDSGRRDSSLTRGPKLPGVEAIRWTRTIADVRLDTPEHYCADVRTWAESVVRDSEALARSAANASPHSPPPRPCSRQTSPPRARSP